MPHRGCLSQRGQPLSAQGRSLGAHKSVFVYSFRRACASRLGAHTSVLVHSFRCACASRLGAHRSVCAFIQGRMRLSPPCSYISARSFIQGRMRLSPPCSYISARSFIQACMHLEATCARSCAGTWKGLGPLSRSSHLREKTELPLLQAAAERCSVSPCPPTASRHHHFQPRSLQQPPNRFLLPPVLPFPISFSNFSKLVTNLFFLNKIWLCYRSAQKSANGFLSRSGQTHLITGIRDPP